MLLEKWMIGGKAVFELAKEGTRDVDWFWSRSYFTPETAARHCVITGDRPSDSTFFAAVFDGHHYEALEVRLNQWSYDGTHERWDVDAVDHQARHYAGHERRMLLYAPIDPGIKSSDVHGAIERYPNADNTAWLFRHCDADYHHDQELRLRADIVSLFQHELDHLMIPVVSASTRERALSARVVWNNLLTVRGWVVDCAIEAVREKHIGWFHQNPLESHLHEFIRGCINKTISIQTAVNSTTLSSVRPSVDRILGYFTKHAYETRWDKAARLKAEAKAKADAAAAAAGNGDEASGQ